MYSQLQGQCFFGLIWIVEKLMQSHGVRVTAGDWYHEAWLWLNHTPQSSSILEKSLGFGGSKILAEFDSCLMEKLMVFDGFDGFWWFLDGFWWYIMVHPNAVTLCLSEPWQWEVHVSHGEFATGTKGPDCPVSPFLLFTPQQIATPSVNFLVGQVGALECFSPQPWSPNWLCGKLVLA